MYVHLFQSPGGLMFILIIFYFIFVYVCHLGGSCFRGSQALHCLWSQEALEKTGLWCTYHLCRAGSPLQWTEAGQTLLSTGYFVIGSPQAVAPPLLRHESLLKTALLRRKPRSAPSELPLYWFLPESPAHDGCCAGEMVKVLAIWDRLLSALQRLAVRVSQSHAPLPFLSVCLLWF